MSTDTHAANSDLLFALMYSSHAAGEVDQVVLDQILAEARSRNAQLGITGILLFRESRFYQYLEGAENDVRAVYDSISRDPRHDRLRILMQKPVPERRFSEWSMGYQPLRQSTAVPTGFRSTFVDLEDSQRPENVLRAVAELAYWYQARASRTQPLADA